MDHLAKFASLFYIVNPYDSMFEKVSELPVPDFLAQVRLNFVIYNVKYVVRRARGDNYPKTFWNFAVSILLDFFKCLQSCLL